MSNPAARVTAGLVGTLCLLGSSGASAQDEERQRLEALEKRVEELEKAAGSGQPGPVRQSKRLEQRVKELEAKSVANEAATRQIISESLSTLGSRINEFVNFGGTLEVFTGWVKGFDNRTENVTRLNTAELDFEIQVNSWTLGSVIFEYDDGTDNTFTTTEDFEVSIDRVNVDTAFLTVGDTTRFWPFATFGRMIVPFGISTGDPVADVLTLEDPLTLEAFETKQDALFLGVELPTPALAPLTRIPTPPPVRPLVVAPLFGGLARLAGYRPTPRPPPPPSFTTLPPDPPPVYAGVYFYSGETFDRGERRGWNPGNHIGATLGYRQFGKCRPYRDMGDEARLRWLHFFCPFSIEYDVDFNSSIFDSRFLESEYRPFLGEIGFVPGLAASIKAELGPVGLVLEWNGALQDANFPLSVDDPIDPSAGFIKIRPSAWQISLGYQFDWNPFVAAIGAQGTYVTVGYSQSTELGGVPLNLGVDPMGNDIIGRVGNVPEKRLLVGFGEWVLDGLRVAFEYSHIIDYPKSPSGLSGFTGKNGTGRSADGVFFALTYEW